MRCVCLSQSGFVCRKERICLSQGGSSGQNPACFLAFFIGTRAWLVWQGHGDRRAPALVRTRVRYSIVCRQHKESDVRGCVSLFKLMQRGKMLHVDHYEEDTCVSCDPKLGPGIGEGIVRVHGRRSAGRPRRAGQGGERAVKEGGQAGRIGDGSGPRRFRCRAPSSCRPRTAGGWSPTPERIRGFVLVFVLGNCA